MRPSHADSVGHKSAFSRLTCEADKDQHVLLREKVVFEIECLIGREHFAFQTPDIVQDLWYAGARKLTEVVEGEGTRAHCRVGGHRLSHPGEREGDSSTTVAISTVPRLDQITSDGKRVVVLVDGELIQRRCWQHAESLPSRNLRLRRLPAIHSLHPSSSLHLTLIPQHTEAETPISPWQASLSGPSLGNTPLP